MPAHDLLSRKPLIGLGTFPFASPFSPVAEETVAEIVNTYLGNGGYYIDTAPTYAFGEVERQLGRLLRAYDRSDFFINTSCGYVRSEDGKSFRISGKAEDVHNDLTESLDLLQLKHVDSYISHIPDKDTPFGETVDALLEEKRIGRAKYIGVSNVTLDQLKEYNQDGAIDIVQNRFSHINRSIDPAFRKYCRDNGISIVAYQVIERGLLTEKKLDELAPAPDDLRSRKPEFAEQCRRIINRWVQGTLYKAIEQTGLSVTAFSIAWVLTHPEVHVAQVGSTNSMQLDALFEAHEYVHSIDSMSLELIETPYNELVGQCLKETDFQTIRGMLGVEGSDSLSGLSASGR